MAYDATPWGYDVDGVVPPLLDACLFHAMTGFRFTDDERIQAAIDGVTARVRAHCGWHISGSLKCRATLDGGETSVWLPSTHVTDVTKVSVCGTDVTDSCEWSRRGLLRLPHSPDRLGAVVVEFDSGLSEPPAELLALVVDRVTNAVSMPFGVQQETAGSVSVSYAYSAIAGQGVSGLPATDRATLSSYRLEEVR